jgi:hypothetical protein
MKRILFFLSVALLAVLAACGQGPAPSRDVPTGTPALIDLDELARDPAAYEGHWVRVSGQYGELPLPLCDGVLHLSPATWGLSEGGVVLRVAGLEGVLNRLAMDGLQMTVEGQWQRWEGPIGCGRSAVQSVVWYLRARQILAPNPLVAATLTPRGFVEEPVGGMITPTVTAQPTAIAGVGTPTRPPSPMPTVPLSPLATPTEIRSPLATPTPSLSPTPTTSFPPSPTPTPTEPFSPIASPTLTPTANGTADGGATSTGTPFPSYTPDGTTTPTPTRTTTPSPTPGGTSNQGAIETGDVMNSILAAGQSHLWTYYGQVGDRINIMTGPAAVIDTEITVNNPQGNRLLTLNSGGAGQMDMVEDLELTQTGNYQIVIRDVDSDSGAYALAVTAVDGMAIAFPGNLDYGDSVSRPLPADTYHIWHFQGTIGDLVTVVVAPQDDIDVEFDLYRPTMGDLVSHVDSSGPGDPEELTFQLDETGFYSILIQEYSGFSGSYGISLTDD